MIHHTHAYLIQLELFTEGDIIMDGISSTIFPAILDTFVVLLLVAFIVFVMYPPTSTDQAVKKPKREIVRNFNIVGTAVVSLLLFWLVIVTVSPRYGGQSLVPGPTPTAVPTVRPSPTVKPTAKPTLTPTPTVTPTVKPRSKPTPTPTPTHS